jgi:hypothetical protein
MMERDNSQNAKDYPFITAVTAACTLAVLLAPGAAFAWWMEWWPFRADESEVGEARTAATGQAFGRNDDVDRALTEAMLKGWRGGEK